MAGVFFYERAQFETYEATWSTTETSAASETGTLDAGTSQSYSVSMDADRLSQVRVGLEWSDETGQPDTFELIVQGPNGTYTDSTDGSDGSLELTFSILDQPGTSTVPARSIADAREQLNASVASTNGTGDWSITVTLVDAPGEQTPIGGQETTEDGSEDYELTVTYERWVPSLIPQ